MRSSLTRLLASTAAIAALTPGVASAHTVDDVVRINQANRYQANVAFSTDQVIHRWSGGTLYGHVRFQGQKFPIRLSAARNNDYVATVTSADRLVLGRRYTVRIIVHGELIAVPTIPMT